jgi:hypothetical protein
LFAVAVHLHSYSLDSSMFEQAQGQ